MTPSTTRPLVAAIFAAASLSIAACGGGDTAKAPTILNTEKVERAIETSSLAQRKKHAVVTCPAGVHQKQGLEFSCMAVVKGVGSRFVVTQIDGVGHVHYVAR